MTTQRTRPNARVLQVAQLIENAAVAVSQTFEHIACELLAVDGYGGSSFNFDGAAGRTNNELNGIESRASARIRLEADAEQLRDDITALESIATSIMTMCRRVERQREAITDKPPSLEHKCNGGIGKKLEGWREWARECSNIVGDNPIIEQMCDECLARMNKWRTDNDLDPINRDSLDRHYRHEGRTLNGRFAKAVPNAVA